MTRKLLLIPFALAGSLLSAHGQTIHAGAPLPWGEEVHGCKATIAMTNQVIPITTNAVTLTNGLILIPMKTAIWLDLRITNSTSSEIISAVPMPEEHFAMELFIDDFGKTTDLSQYAGGARLGFGAAVHVPIDRGHEKSFPIPLSALVVCKPGHYKCVAILSLSAGETPFSLISNAVDVWVK